MATKKSSSGKRSASSAGKTSSKKKKYVGKNGKRPIRREVGAVICFFLGVFGILSYFNIDAIFISFFRTFLGGMAGWGFYVYPVAFLVCAFILAFHRGRPVVFRVTCAVLFPLTLGALFFVTFGKGDTHFAWKLFVDFFKDGAAGGNSGVITGLVGLGFKAVFSRVGAAVVFGIVTIFFGLSAMNVTFSSIIEAVKNREHLDYEEEEIPEKPKAKSDKKKVIDLPVDDPATIRKAKAKETDYFADIPLDTKVAGTAPDGTSESSNIPFVFGDPVDLKDEKSTKKDAKAALAEDVAVAPEQTTAEKRAEVNKAAAEVTKAIEFDAETGDMKPQYVKPPIDLLTLEFNGSVGGSEELKTTAKRLSETLHSFDIAAHIVDCTRGPSVTRYELELEQGVKLNKLTNLSNDIALSLGASGVRIAPIPGKISVVGVEVPNKAVSMVYLREVIASNAFNSHKSALAFALGKDIAGSCIVGDISKLPHLLIAGTTGSGKSVCMNSLIISLLYKSSPDDVRLIMVDPKMVELGGYNGIPHLLIPVVTDPKKAAGALQWAVNEMMRRYSIFSEAGTKDIDGYNAAVKDNPERRKLYRIVVVIDELADLMMVAAKEIEEYICRVAQMGRAAGVHLVVATQRPSANVITGLMKANIPSRIAFAVASAMESRIILDTAGAEALVGKGDMLYQPIGSTKPTRIQGTMVSNEEVEAVVEFIKNSAQADYSDEVLQHIERHGAEKEQGSGISADTVAADDADELLSDAIDVVVETGQASVSMLQRRLKLGYSRAARIVDQMEERGIVGPFEGSKPRQLLVTKDQWAQMKMKGVTIAGQEAAPEYVEEEI